MNVELPVEQQAFVERLVAQGRYPSAGDAIRDGVRLLISQERLKEQIDIGMDQAERGMFVDHDTVFGQLKTMATAATSQPEVK